MTAYEVGIAMLVATAVNSIVLALTGHLQWPKWKTYARFVVYVALSGIGAYFFGVYVYIYIVGYQATGLVAHILWCRKHGLDWKDVDTEAYIESQKAWFDKIQRRGASGRDSLAVADEGSEDSP